MRRQNSFICMLWAAGQDRSWAIQLTIQTCTDKEVRWEAREMTWWHPTKQMMGLVRPREQRSVAKSSGEQRCPRSGSQGRRWRSVHVSRAFGSPPGVDAVSTGEMPDANVS